MTAGAHSTPNPFEPASRSATTGTGTASESEITDLLVEWSKGDARAGRRVLPHLYRELHRIALAYFVGERRDHTLQPTALVHEAFLRLEAQREVDWDDRTHFLAIAARLMRQLLVEHARRHQRLKRGGGQLRVVVDDERLIAPETPAGVLALDEGLAKLAALDAEKAAVVELRFFGGLTIEETAACLGVSRPTVVRQWRRARAWLHHELTEGWP